MSMSLDDLARDVLSISLRATASLQMQMAAALIGKGQDELRKHMQDSAELHLKSVAALAPRVEVCGRDDTIARLRFVDELGARD